MFKLSVMASVAAFASMVPSVGQAAVVVGPTINTLPTFTDTLTGRNWVKMNVYFNRTSDAMFADVIAKGFTVGTRLDVEQLLNSLPLAGGQWSTYKAIMGDAPNRELIWGSYGPVVSNTVGWAYAFDGDSNWVFVDNAVSSNAVPNGGSDAADMNVWAFSGGVAAVPEPATWAMMIGGFGIAGMALRRRRQRMTVSYG